MRYSIGEFAQILGVTADTLRLYEKLGIISPIKDSKNNYRYFNDLDARNLLLSRWYRSMEIPLQEVAILTKNASLNDIAHKINEMQVNLEDEIKKSTMLLNKIKEIKDEIIGIEVSLNRCKKKRMPGIYRLKQTNQNTLIDDDFLRSMSNTWMNILPYSFYSFRIERKELLSGEDFFEYSWGLAIFEDEIQNFDLEINENVEYLTPKTYITSVIAHPYDENIMRDSLEFMLDHIKEHNYSITGDIIGRILLKEKINGINITYLEVNIPI